MWLNIVWYVLFVVIIAGYLIMDGFDIGVGILHPFLAKNDQERRISLNSIGPVWDGNEVWAAARSSPRSRWSTPLCSPASTQR